MKNADSAEFERVKRSQIKNFFANHFYISMKAYRKYVSACRAIIVSITKKKSIFYVIESEIKIY